jgi:uncharacterized GH25 family protein
LARIAAAVLLAGPAAAHDHWIEPSSFRPAVGERLDVRLCVGHPGESVEQPRDPRRIVRFELVHEHGAKPLVGLDGRSPAAFLTTRAPGTAWLVYQSNHAFAELEPATYARYLEEEGLDAVRAERERRGESAQPGRDSYLRCDKALVRIGDAPPTDFARVLGLPIELVLETDPLDAHAGELALRLERAGAPLADHQVKWMRLEAPHTIQLARTGADGRVRFPRASGRFVASAVHQRRARPEQGLEGDWEGLWASLALEVPAP